MKRLIVFIIAIILVPTTVWGASTLRADETVSVTSEQKVEGDFYGMGETVVISGEIVGDLVTVASKLKFDGKIDEDLLALAWMVDIEGVTSDDVRIAAGEVSVTGEIAGDLLVIAKTLRVDQSSKIAGDMIFFGSDAEISGAVEGSVFGSADRLRLDGSVAGEVDVTSSNLVIGDKADIKGDVKYESFAELKRAQNAQISGKIIRNDPVFEQENTFQGFIIGFLITLFATLVIYSLFRPFVQKTVHYTREHLFRSLLVGFGVFFLIPIASFILIISTLGSLVGAILISVYVGLLLASFVISGVVAGSYLSTLFGKSSKANMIFAMLGVLAIHVSLYIPLIGMLLLIALVTLTLGSLAINLYRLLRNT